VSPVPHFGNVPHPGGSHTPCFYLGVKFRIVVDSFLRKGIYHSNIPYFWEKNRQNLFIYVC
jgi:hypothetical protein